MNNGSVNTRNPAEQLIGRIFLPSIEGLAWMLSRENDTQRTGGVIAVALVNRNDGTTDFASRTIGVVGMKGCGYAFNAAEKIKRLRNRRASGSNEVAASQSADPDNLTESLRTYGGCLVFDGIAEGPYDVYISFSGYPPRIDEVLAFMAGEILKYPAPPGYTNDLIPRAREIYDGRLWEGLGYYPC